MMDLAIAVLLVLVGAFGGAFADRVVSRRQDRFDVSVDLYRRYNAPEMLKARNRAWRFLNVDYPKNLRPIQSLYADGDDPEADIYQPLIRVINFWHLVFKLHAAKSIDAKLCHDFFRYQFTQWSDALKPLALATKEYDGDHPEWLEAFGEGAMKWLLKEPNRQALVRS